MTEEVQPGDGRQLMLLFSAEEEHMPGLSSSDAYLFCGSSQVPLCRFRPVEVQVIT